MRANRYRETTPWYPGTRGKTAPRSTFSDAVGCGLWRGRAHRWLEVRMLAKTEKASVATSVDNWLAQFERALAEPDMVLLKALFHADSHWRDVLALTWHIRTISGLDAIVRELKAHVGRARPAGFRTAPDRTVPRRVTRAGTTAIEAIFQFETADGRGGGVLRLTPDVNDGNALKAWTLLTSLDELTGVGEQAGRSRLQD